MRGSLMRRWTAEQHRKILEEYPNNADAASAYNGFERGVITRQLVKYWRTIFLDNGGKLAAADAALKQTRKIIHPNLEDDIGNVDIIPAYSDSVLVIPDQHAPYQHPDTVAFLALIKETFSPTVVINLGDELDYHALSFHDSDPNLESAGTELERGKVFLTDLHSLFPQMLLCHSNHGSMVYRRAKAHGIPVQMIRKYRDIIFPNHGAPDWSWAFSWRVGTALGDVMFKHQATSVLTEAAHNACNLIVGHNHGDFGIEYSASSAHLYYGAVSGCLVDKDSLAFAYGKNSVRKPIIGCTVILRGRPVLIPMILNGDGRWIRQL